LRKPQVDKSRVRGEQAALEKLPSQQIVLKKRKMFTLFFIFRLEIVFCQQGFDLVQASLDFPYSGKNQNAKTKMLLKT